MPDISMCGDRTCPSRRMCYRNPASGTQAKEFWQAWMTFARHDKDKCASYDELEPAEVAERDEKGLREPT